MSHWQYRVVRIKDDFSETGHLYAIAEIYYDHDPDKDRHGHCTRRTTAESLEGLGWVLNQYKKALKAPVIDVDEL